VTGSSYDRFHIRIWDLPNGNVIASVHHEYLVTIGGNPSPRAQEDRHDSFKSGNNSIPRVLAMAKRVGRWVGAIPRAIGGKFPRLHPHRPDSFESGKDSICDDFRANGRQVLQNGVRMDNYKRVLYCSGEAALISL